MDSGIQILGKRPADAGRVLTPDALAFLARLSRKFEPTRRALLARRAERRQRFDSGEPPDFLPETEAIRKGEWKVAATPPDLQKRWVEITGPGERKMMINAFNSGANVFMADFEDSLSPTWDNVVNGQGNLIDAEEASQILDSLVEASKFVEFLTLPAYPHLE
jgi:malate synthase